MKALVIAEDLTLRLEERPEPAVREATDVLIRVVQSGICGTDRSVVVGKFPAEPGTVMGHEAVGEVVAVGERATSLAPGDRIVINPTLYCGDCAKCAAGEWNFCLHKAGTEVGLDYDGSFAEYMVLPARFCHKLPDHISYDRAVVIEPLACVMNNVSASGARFGERVLILGGGPMGVLTAMLCKHLGAQVVLVDPDPVRRGLAADMLDYGVGEVAVQAEAAPDSKPDVVFDTVGTLLEEAVRIVGSQGRVVVVGFNANAVASLRPLEILQKGISIIGAGDYNGRIFPAAVDLASSIPLERLITHRYALEEHETAFGLLAAAGSSQYGAMKVLLAPRAEALVRA